jgi:hypothetical protein
MRRSQMNKSDGDQDRAKVAALLNGLLDLTGDQNAITVSVARLRKAAHSYSDHELKRFAQLIILCDHPPGEWQERLLAEVQSAMTL